MTHMFVSVLLLAAILCAASAAGDAVPINVKARLDRNVITIGDKIRYELEV